jgi:hypothetical protein
MGKDFDGATLIDLSIFGFISDAPDRRDQASDGMQRLAIVTNLVGTVHDALRASQIAAELDRDRPRLSGEALAYREAELSRYRVRDAEARAYLGVDAEAGAEAIAAAALAAAEKAGLTASELAEAEDYLEPLVHPQFTHADVLADDVAGEGAAPPV